LQTIQLEIDSSLESAQRNQKSLQKYFWALHGLFDRHEQLPIVLDILFIVIYIS